MERSGRLTPQELQRATQMAIKLTSKCVVILEKHGVLKHKMTIEEVEAADLRSKELTADYLEDRIDLPTYREELDKLPRLNLRQLAQGLHYKG